MNRSNVVHYLCFYAEKNSNYIFFPSAIPKIEYIVNTLKQKNKVALVSIVQSKKGYSAFKKTTVDGSEERYTFASYKSSISLFNKVDVVFRYIQLLHYLFFKIKKGDKLVIYHSLFYYKLIKFVLKFKEVDAILQVEEMYSAVTPNLRHLEKFEAAYISSFKKLIVVNDLLKEKFTSNTTVAIVCYGDYRSTIQVPTIQNKDDDTIWLLYAGVIESSRRAVFFAIQTMEFLPEKYKLNIAGFGTDTDITLMLDEINKSNNKFGNRIFYKGYLSGSSYSEILNLSHIGLSCHQYTKEELISADNSFPSKLIVYLKFNLAIVSNNIDCVKKSSIAEYINFFDESNLESAILAIQSVNLESNKSLVIEKLNLIFIKNLNKLL